VTTGPQVAPVCEKYHLSDMGVFHVAGSDPTFRPAWSRYHWLWEIHTGGYSPLHSVWLPREPAEFEEARQAVLPILGRALKQQPRPTNLLGRMLAALAANAQLPGQVAGRPGVG
jgi:hypothetical protein